MLRFDVTIAGELNLDLILYGAPEEIPRERELLVPATRLAASASFPSIAGNALYSLDSGGWLANLRSALFLWSKLSEIPLHRQFTFSSL